MDIASLFYTHSYVFNFSFWHLLCMHLQLAWRYDRTKRIDLYVIYQTRGRDNVLFDFQRPKSGLKTNFGNRMKHSIKCMMYLLISLIILGEIQSKSSSNFMIIKITLANLLDGRDFLCFLLMHCSWFELRMSHKYLVRRKKRRTSTTHLWTPSKN